MFGLYALQRKARQITVYRHPVQQDGHQEPAPHRIDYVGPQLPSVVVDTEQPEKQFTLWESITAHIDTKIGQLQLGILTGYAIGLATVAIGVIATR